MMHTSWVWFYVLHGVFWCCPGAENATGLFAPLPQHCQRVSTITWNIMVTEPQYKCSMSFQLAYINQLMAFDSCRWLDGFI